MSNGALTPDEPVEEVEGGGALTQPVDPLIAQMSGPDRMVSGPPAVNPERLSQDVADYKDRTGDIDLDGKKDNVWKQFKGWWKKGKEGGDDPTTAEVDEGSPDYQVTGFMGGMTRQELATFVFQWGASMMVNADKGLGGAFGQSALDAEAGHTGRRLASQEREDSMAQQNIENQMNQQKADAMTQQSIAATTRADAYAKGLNEPRGGVGEWKREFYRSIGWSDEKIAQAAEGILTTEQIFDEVSSALRKEKADAASKETMSLPDNMRAKTTLPDGTKVPTAQLTEDQILMLAGEASKKQVEARGALSPKPQAPSAEDAFSAAMDKHGTP